MNMATAYLVLDNPAKPQLAKANSHSATTPYPPPPPSYHKSPDFSAANWRQKAHNSPLPPPPKDTPSPHAALSEIALILAEMKAQQKEDKLCRECNNNWAQHKADLDKKSRITAIAKRFFHEDILKPDGTNLYLWERMIQLHAEERFHNPDFFLGNNNVCIEDLDELVACGIIHALVDSNLTYNLLDLSSASDVYIHLVFKFRVINQASQLQA
ncbi:hypothetical protein PCASD_15936 [Puccinia coronata f. sp. avenae]|uniref:Uncharacterized protein n=1 Tax=Puccinia coronata f. sp. avenae TaxID=200324 RepID=A0A2N5UF20_9BASI|nr:hypothetical protein PCASD_15936 [Puccinia coronata f. sp. avenae]